MKLYIQTVLCVVSSMIQVKQQDSSMCKMFTKLIIGPKRLKLSIMEDGIPIQACQCSKKIYGHADPISNHTKSGQILELYCNIFFELIKETRWVTTLHFCDYRVIANTYANMMTHVEDGCENPSCFKGYYADMLYHLQSLLNFTYTIEKSNVPGARLENGTWTGMIGNGSIYGHVYLY